MDKISEDNDLTVGARRFPCRVAYTLNNTQPVLCTIIGDQPFFYMDAEIVDDGDDGALTDPAVQAMEKDIESLKRKIDAYDRLSLEFTLPADRRIQDFMVDAALIGSSTDTAAPVPLEDLSATLGKSRYVKALLDHAESYGVLLAYNDQIDTVQYDRKAARIFVHPGLRQADQLMLCARELRRHWQHRNGTLVDPLMFHPDQAVLVHRAQVADLTTSMIRAAWEFQLAGLKSAWETVENSSMADLGRAFAREAYIDFRTINNGQACASVFESWFLSDRCRREDKKLIQRMLTDYRGYMFEDERASRVITNELIAALGNVPHGKNYLAQYAQTIINDPIFTEIRDRSNANFLWFVKFERSFREAEQDLQTSKSIHKPDIRSGAPIKALEDYGNEGSADIIAHPRGMRAFTGNGPTLEGDPAESNVIYVQFCTLSK